MNNLPKPKRKTSVLVEDFLFLEEESSEVKISNLAFYIWADSKYISEIKNIDGVTNTIPSEMNGRTIVMIDKRYDIDEIKNAIVQYIKLSEGEDIYWSKSQIDKLSETP